jgi:Ku protein
VYVENSDIVKGVEAVAGLVTILTAAELKMLEVAKTEKVDVIQFCDEGDVDSIYFEDGIYYLAPDKGHGKSFATFREGLVGRMAIADYASRGHDHRVAISSFNRALIMRYLRPHAEVRVPSDIPQYDAIPESADPKDAKLMDMLIAQFSGEFDPSAIVDVYASNFKKLVDSKVTGDGTFVLAVEPAQQPMADMTAALEASIAAMASKVKKTAKVVAIKRTRKKAA